MNKVLIAESIKSVTRKINENLRFVISSIESEAYEGDYDKGVFRYSVHDLDSDLRYSLSKFSLLKHNRIKTVQSVQSSIKELLEEYTRHKEKGILNNPEDHLQEYCLKTIQERFQSMIDYLEEEINSKAEENINPIAHNKQEVEGKASDEKLVEKIKLELNKTQIVYLFQLLIDEKLINESLNPKIWHLVSQYFLDKDGQPLKDIHSTKYNLANTKTAKPKKGADTIETIVSKTKTKKTS